MSLLKDAREAEGKRRVECETAMARAAERSVAARPEVGLPAARADAAAVVTMVSLNSRPDLPTQYPRSIVSDELLRQ